MSARGELLQPPAGREGEAFAERGGDSYMRRAGRTFVQAFHGAVRAIRLYPVENAAVQKALDELTAVARDILAKEHDLEFRLTGEFLFLNATRLRLDLDTYASFSHLLGLCRKAGIGLIQVRPGVTARDWLVFLSLLQAPVNQPPAARLLAILQKLDEASVHGFELSAPVEREEDREYRELSKEVAKRTYAQSVAVARDVMTSVRLGRSPSIKRVKRVVQGIVDQILNDENSLIGLTTIRDYDEYTFIHSVNVCIFSVALGRRLGLTKLQLYDLGLAALFHDIGKSRIPAEVLNKPSDMTESDWQVLATHPWLGVLALFHLRGQQELPYRAMVVAHEHHMKIDKSGYPRCVRPRTLSIFSKIVAVADGFDAATSRRVYQSAPMSPADVLRGMRDNPRRGFDPVIVKAFINLTGIYPVGTLVVLDTFELGIVHAANPNPESLSRPIVRVVSDDRGNLLFPGDLIDLSAQDESGSFTRSIIRTADPERYGIRISDYFV